MPPDVNRFGLKRAIPTDVAKAVRRRCGFGCVVCGSAIYDYDHFDPEFKDATTHNPSGIILLCPNHHREKWGVLSRKTLEQWAKVPFCKSSDFSHLAMDIDNLTVTIGPVTSKHCMTALEVGSTFYLDKISFGSVVHTWIPVSAQPPFTPPFCGVICRCFDRLRKAS